MSGFQFGIMNMNRLTWIESLRVVALLVHCPKKMGCDVRKQIAIDLTIGHNEILTYLTTVLLLHRHPVLQ